MNFKFYEILSTIVPGFLVYSTILLIFDIDFSNHPIVFATVFAYALGYLVNILSSWLEPVLFYTWGGKPSNNLLDGKSIWKVNFYAHEKAKQLLMGKTDSDEPSNDELFNIAMRKVFSSGSERVSDFNGGFAFGRSFFICALTAAILLSTQYHSKWEFYVVSFVVLGALWLRAKQKAYYFAREVLNEYLALTE